MCGAGLFTAAQTAPTNLAIPRLCWERWLSCVVSRASDPEVQCRGGNRRLSAILGGASKALGGYCHVDEMGKVTIHDIDPKLFARRVPHSLLRIGLTNKRELWPTPIGTLCNRLLDSYNYFDSYQDIQDVIACSMLSLYVPGLTGSLNGVKDDLPAFLSGLQRQ